MAGHRHAQATADRPPCRFPIAPLLRGDGVDVSEQDAVRPGSVADSPTCFARDGVAVEARCPLDTHERSHESRSRCFGHEPVAIEPSSDLVELLGQLGSRLALTRRGLQGQARRDRHPPVSSLLAVPASRLIGGYPRTRVVALSQTDLGRGDECAGHLDLVAVRFEHLEGSAHKRLGVLEQTSVGECVGVVCVDLRHVATRVRRDITGFGSLELGDRSWQVAPQHREVTKVVMCRRDVKCLSEVICNLDRGAQMTLGRPEVADLSKHCPEGDPCPNFSGPVAMPLEGTAG